MRKVGSSGSFFVGRRLDFDLLVLDVERRVPAAVCTPSWGVLVGDGGGVTMAALGETIIGKSSRDTSTISAATASGAGETLRESINMITTLSMLARVSVAERPRCSSESPANVFTALCSSSSTFNSGIEGRAVRLAAVMKGGSVILFGSGLELIGLMIYDLIFRASLQQIQLGCMLHALKNHPCKSDEPGPR